MGEEVENADSGGASSQAIDPAAIAVALSGASREQADAFLKKQEALVEDQRKLVQLQAKELAHELKLRHWSLQLRHASAILKFALEVSVALIVIAVAWLIGAVVWNAAHDNGLIVESFSVPPDLAARGLTGQVVATQMLDDLANLQAQTGSIRAPGSYANDWGNDLKVEIPDTGVSIGEANNYLHQLLGHQTRISGEVVRTATGLTIIARAGFDAGKRISGPEGDFDGLLEQAAEAIYASTQPYRYSVYLIDQGKSTESLAFDQANSQSGNATEQAWLNSGLSNQLGNSGRAPEAAEAAHAAVTADPDSAWSWGRVAVMEHMLEHDQAALAANRTYLRLLNGSASKDMRPEAVPFQKAVSSGAIDELLGDYAAASSEIFVRNPGLDFSTEVGKQTKIMLSRSAVNVLAGITTLVDFADAPIPGHDLGWIPRILAEAPAIAQAFAETDTSRGALRGKSIRDSTQQAFSYIRLSLAVAERDWADVLQTATTMETQQPSMRAAYLYFPTKIWPVVAYAKAMQGDFAAAHAEIDKTPSDCDLCLRTRGKIDAAEKNYNGATFWFARAAQLAPSIPFAFTDWAQMLLARGDLDRAIAKFKSANQKGPHFADPLEGWGEALMAKNRSDLALAKFEEAEKYAPSWGRLHLKWGEALYYAGKKDGAAKQFAQAASRDLTPSEKSELAGMNHG